MLTLGLGFRSTEGSGGGGSGAVTIISLAAEPAAVDVSPALPTGTGTGATHPSVVDVGAGNVWNGYRYWMAYTPYPSEPDEQPFIVASNDGSNWEEPAGISNPIEPAPPGSPAVWNNDTDMMMSPDGTTLLLTFGVYDGVAETADIYLRTSTDGITWTAKTLLFSALRIASQSWSYNDGVYYLTYNKFGAVSQSPTSLARRSSTDLVTWTSEEAVVFTPPAGKEVWHLEARYFGGNIGKFILLATCKTIAAASTNTDTLAWGQSSDGLDYGTGLTLFSTADSVSLWDGGRVYRPSAVRSERGFDLWYGGGAATWRVGRSSIIINPGQAGNLMLDDFATASHSAFSLSRYLRKAYVGRPVAMVRRSSDNEYRLVWPNASNQLELEDGSSLTTWLGADTCYCVAIFDQTGNRSHLVQTTEATQLTITPSVAAIGSKPALVGDGARWMRSLNKQRIGNCQAAMAQLSTGADNAFWGNLAANYVGHNAANCLISNSLSIAVANKVATFARYVAVNQAGASASLLRRGGVTLGTGTRSGASSSSYQTIGVQISGGTPFRILNGQVAELVISDTAFAQADYEGIEASQLAHYGV